MPIADHDIGEKLCIY